MVLTCFIEEQNCQQAVFFSLQARTCQLKVILSLSLFNEQKCFTGPLVLSSGPWTSVHIQALYIQQVFAAP